MKTERQAWSVRERSRMCLIDVLLRRCINVNIHKLSLYSLVRLSIQTKRKVVRVEMYEECLQRDSK